MPTIEERPTKDGVSYRAKVRLKGFRKIEKSFASRKDAVRWGHKIEQDLKDPPAATSPAQARSA